MSHSGYINRQRNLHGYRSMGKRFTFLASDLFIFSPALWTDINRATNFDLRLLPTRADQTWDLDMYEISITASYDKSLYGFVIVVSGTLTLLFLKYYEFDIFKNNRLAKNKTRFFLFKKLHSAWTPIFILKYFTFYILRYS